MAEIETVNQENGTGPENQEKTFTQAEVDKMILDRVHREKAKYSDYESYKEKAGKYDEIQNSGKTELQKATERADALQKQLDAITKANSVKEVRNKVSAEMNIPASLLTGEDEETCKAQAKAILEFARPNEYPGTKRNNGAKTSSQQTDPAMREFAHQIFGR